MSVPTDVQLRTLKAALLKAKPPYCSGALSVDAKSLCIFYANNDGIAGRVNLHSASDKELERLSEACAPATFGHNQKDVLDLSYRKAGKLDEECFATKLSLEKMGLMDIIRYGLLEGDAGTRPFRAELYKLNVYDKGCFFKSHKDTPRGKDMFGSLVVTFPTSHEGGALVFRHDEKEWVFDSGKTVAEQSGPCIAYAAFYSDIEHEVTPVNSGYRVTLTYNLYFDKCDTHVTVPPAQTIPAHAATFNAAFSRLLADPSFLPEGGNIGFGLFHQYPVNTIGEGSDLESLANRLKGRDAMIMKACKDLSLHTQLSLLYRDRENDAELLADRAPFDCGVDEQGLLGDLLDNGAKVIKAGKEYPFEDLEIFKVTWVNEVSIFNRIKTTYATYGNEVSMSYCYGTVCLIVQVGKPQDRSLD